MRIFPQVDHLTRPSPTGGKEPRSRASVTLGKSIKTGGSDCSGRTDGRKEGKALLPPSREAFLPAAAVSALKERRASLAPTPGENFFCRFADTLFFADNGRGRMQEWLSNLQTCLRKAEACFPSPAVAAAVAAGCRSLGLQASHIGRVVVGDMCRNYM